MSATILLVEDHRDLAFGLRVNFEDAGHRVIVAHTGRDGVTRARQHPPDLVVLDLSLPDIDGFDVLQCRPTATSPDLLSDCCVFTLHGDIEHFLLFATEFVPLLPNRGGNLAPGRSDFGFQSRGGLAFFRQFALFGGDLRATARIAFLDHFTRRFPVRVFQTKAQSCGGATGSVKPVLGL